MGLFCDITVNACLVGINDISENFIGKYIFVYINLFYCLYNLHIILCVAAAANGQY